MDCYPALPFPGAVDVGGAIVGNPWSHPGRASQAGHVCVHATRHLPELYLSGLDRADVGTVAVKRDEISQ